MDLIEYSQSGDGYAAWQQQRLQATKQISQKLGLPLGHEVELRLLDGVILRGRLRLRESCSPKCRTLATLSWPLAARLSSTPKSNPVSGSNLRFI